MDLLIGFFIFLISMIGALVCKLSMIYALLIGLLSFVVVALRKGFKLDFLGRATIKGIKSSLIVIYVMSLIGFVTATWRISGTITIFVYYGIKIITPSFFLLITFLLSCFLSYALGTSFGVAGTVGVIFMALAKSGGVDPIVTAGVLMSGIYFGDRCSPVSSSANLVAGITETKIYDNVVKMMKTGGIPLILATLIYTYLSFHYPISHVDENLVGEFESAFIISPWALIPAILMLVLPLIKISVIISMSLSIISGILVAFFVQNMSVITILKSCILGYEADTLGLGKILNGGGLISMIEIVIIMIISGCYSGIFNETGMLNEIQDRMKLLALRIGKFPTMITLGIATSMIFCNQTIATLMCNNLTQHAYENTDIGREERAIDMENSVILIGCIVPWCIGCTVPLAFFGVGLKAMYWAFYMYLIPICYIFTKKFWYDSL